MADLLHSGTDISEEEKNEAIRNIFGEVQEYNRFYNGASVIYRIAEFLFLGVFLFYIILSAANNAGSISYAGLQYMARNFAVRLDENEENSSEIIYDPDMDLHFSAFGKSFAVCGNSGISIYSATGRRTCRKALDMNFPVMCASEKYVLTFDDGYNSYSVFNTFSEVYTGVSERPIKGAAVGNDGYYALISSADDYTSAVTLYNSDFVPVNRYLKNGYVVCAALDGKGKLLIGTADVDDAGSYVCELMICEYGNDTPSAVSIVKECFPLKCGFSDSGIYLIGDTAVYGFDLSGDNAFTYSYADRELRDLAVSEGAVMLLFTGDPMKKMNEAVIVDFEGSVVCDRKISGNVIALTVFDRCGYILKENELLTLNGDGVLTAETRHASAGDRILAYDQGRLYLCTRSAAYAVSAAE